MTALEFRNKLVNKLNNANRYVGGTCNGNAYPEAELFEVDEVYDIIDEILEETSEYIELKKMLRLERARSEFWRLKSLGKEPVLCGSYEEIKYITS